MSRPRCLSQVRRRIPVPAGAAQHTNPDDDHLRAAHPPAHGLPVPCDGAAFVSEQLDTYLQVSGPKSPSPLAGLCPAFTSKQCKTISQRSRWAVVQPASPGRDESVIYVQAIVRTTSRPAGSPAEPSPRPHHLPSFTSSLQKRVSSRTLHHKPTQLIPVRART